MNLLILGMIRDAQTVGLSHWLSDLLSTKNTEIRYVLDAYSSFKANLLDCLTWADILVFPASVVAEDDVRTLLYTLSHIKREVTVVFENHDTERLLDRLISDEMAYKLAHHRFFQLGPVQKRISIAEKVLKWTVQKNKLI